MTTLLPTHRSSMSPFQSLFSDPFDDFFNMAPMRTTKAMPMLMRTDILETEGGFQLIIDLPGFTKENVTADLKDGYLKVTVETPVTTEEDAKAGTWVCKERFSGKASRSFYVGEDIAEDGISAKFENGTLKIDLPKKQPEPKLEAGRSIAIS